MTTKTAALLMAFTVTSSMGCFELPCSDGAPGAACSATSPCADGFFCAFSDIEDPELCEGTCVAVSTLQDGCLDFQDHGQPCRLSASETGMCDATGRCIQPPPDDDGCRETIDETKPCQRPDGGAGVCTRTGDCEE